MPIKILVPGIRAFPTSVRDLELLLKSLQVLPDDDSTGTPQLQDDSVTNAKLRNSLALSVIGRATDSVGDPADIAFAVDNTFLVRRGNAIGAGPLVDADIPSTIARDSEVTSAITAHESALDPHPQYLTQAEGDALYDALGAAAAVLPDIADDYADDAAAAVGGIAVGQLYHTSGVVKIRLT